ncbi:MAG: NusG domain II-containing protein [Lachnospiraceae bacterium]|nr:NusG domain II-containing protein [Lachnospiraceae bacterium]
MKRRDLILIILLLVLAAGSYVVMNLFSEKGSKVIVTVDSEIVFSGNLSEDATFDVPLDEGENKVIIKNGKAYMDHADCPDQICVDHKPISKTGETIVCLPHKVVVSIEDGEESDVDMMTQ